MGTKPRDTFQAHRPIAKRRALKTMGEDSDVFHSTVTLFAKLRGWSTSVPLATAT